MSASETRSIPRISLRDFASRKQEITSQLIEAASTVGFFILHDQPFPSTSTILHQFDLSQEFFSQPLSEKNKTPFVKFENTGYEAGKQIRPSTGTPDLKESLQLQYHRRNENWPVVSSSDNEDGSAWKQDTMKFMEEVQELSMMVMGCFEGEMGFEEGFFAKRHDVNSKTAQTTLRLIHYPPTSPDTPANHWRAGAHTDYDCLTFLFQKTGESGLEVCPGREAHTSFAMGDTWTPVPAVTGEIVVNIGDMMMSWSDDNFKSNFHRVRAPKTAGERSKSRYSIAYFNQANKEVEIQGPAKKYPVLTGEGYIKQAMERNFQAYGAGKSAEPAVSVKEVSATA